VDLLVSLRRDGVVVRAALRDRLEAVLERRVQLVGLAEAEQSLLLLADVLRDGRVLIDRDDAWRTLTRRKREIERQARGEDRQLDENAWGVLERLEG